MNRKASMQLSINAIVILVMAMAILGIGLGLIRGTLGDGIGKATSAINSIDISEEATSGKTLAGITGISIKRAKDVPLAVSFYNTGHSCSDQDDRANLTINCEGGLTFDKMTAVKVSAPQGQATKVGAVVNTEADAGTYGCTIGIQCGVDDSSSQPNIVEEQTAFIEVTS